MDISEIKDLTDEEFYPLYRAFIEDEPRRARLGTIPKRIDELNREYLASAGTISGGTWERPSGAHDAYPVGWVVTHKGEAWVSTRATNLSEPGVADWDLIGPTE